MSGVEIRFHVDTADWIPSWIREKFKEKVYFKTECIKNL